MSTFVFNVDHEAMRVLITPPAGYSVTIGGDNAAAGRAFPVAVPGQYVRVHTTASVPVDPDPDPDLDGSDAEVDVVDGADTGFALAVNHGADAGVQFVWLYSRAELSSIGHRPIACRGDAYIVTTDTTVLDPREYTILSAPPAGCDPYVFDWATKQRTPLLATTLAAVAETVAWRAAQPASTPLFDGPGHAARCVAAHRDAPPRAAAAMEAAATLLYTPYASSDGWWANTAAVYAYVQAVSQQASG